MQPNFFHLLNSSFALWLDHELLYEGEAYTNYNGTLYYSQDNFLNHRVPYGSPFKQWVSDASITGATIPTGVVLNGSDVFRGGSEDLKIDWEMGRVHFNNTVSNSATVTAGYAIKDFNIYSSSKEAESILFDDKFQLYPTKPNQSRAASPYNAHYPAIFIKFDVAENVPFAFGGQDCSKYGVRCTVVADDQFKLDGAISILNDSARKCFSIIQADDLPRDWHGDLKTGNFYNYNSLINDDLVYISRVRVSRFNEDVNRKINEDAVGAFIDFDLEKIRTPRI